MITYSSASLQGQVWAVEVADLSKRNLEREHNIDRGQFENSLIALKYE